MDTKRTQADGLNQLRVMAEKENARLLAENARLRAALESAVGIIKQWHNMGIQDGSPLDVWQLYYDNAPEMRSIREALS